MLDELKKIADLTPIKTVDRIVVNYSGDWNDGDEISDTAYLSLKSFKQYIPVLEFIAKYDGDVSRMRKAQDYDKFSDNIWDFTPSGQPDSCEMHTIWIDNMIYEATNGERYTITLK